MSSLINDQDLSKSQILIRRLTGIGRGVEDSLRIIAVWLWLQCTWNLQYIAHEISTRNDIFVGRVSDEAMAVFFSVTGFSDEPITVNLLRRTLSMSRGLVSVSSMFSDRYLVAKRIVDIYLELCRVFNVRAHDWFLPSNLNPAAEEWNPVIDRAPEADRCLFLTFSNGYPLTEFQIVNFFQRKYGQCVERIYVHRTYEEGRTLFGKVVFKGSCYPRFILRGQIEARYFVDGRPLWCKKFDPSRINRR